MMKTMLDKIKKGETELLSAIQTMNTAHETIDDILKQNSDKNVLSVDDAFEVSINLDIAKNEYSHARKIQADVDGMIEILVSELNKLCSELSKKLTQPEIEHRQKMLREKYDSFQGREFEQALKMLTRDLFETKASKDFAEQVFNAYGIRIDDNSTIKDVLDAGFKKQNDEE